MTSTAPDPAPKAEPVRLTDALEGHEGRWAALKDGEVIAAQDTFDHLYQTSTRTGSGGPPS